MKCKTPPHDAIPSTSRAETQTHQVKEKKTSTKQKHSDDGVIDDDFRKEAEYQPAGDDAVEEEGGGEEEGSKEQVVEVVDEYDDAPTGVDGTELAKKFLMFMVLRSQPGTNFSELDIRRTSVTMVKSWR